MKQIRLQKLEYEDVCNVVKELFDGKIHQTSDPTSLELSFYRIKGINSKLRSPFLCELTIILDFDSMNLSKLYFYKSEGEIKFLSPNVYISDVSPLMGGTKYKVHFNDDILEVDGVEDVQSERGVSINGYQWK